MYKQHVSISQQQPTYQLMLVYTLCQILHGEALSGLTRYRNDHTNIKPAMFKSWPCKSAGQMQHLQPGFSSGSLHWMKGVMTQACCQAGSRQSRLHTRPHSSEVRHLLGSHLTPCCAVIAQPIPPHLCALEVQSSRHCLQIKAFSRTYSEPWQGVLTVH